METRIRDLADMINEIAGNDRAVDLRPARDWDRSGTRFGSTEKSERLLGFKACYPRDRKACGGRSSGRKPIADLIARCIERHRYFLERVA